MRPITTPDADNGIAASSLETFAQSLLKGRKPPVGWTPDYHQTDYVYRLRLCLEHKEFASGKALYDRFSELRALAHPDAVYGLNLGLVIAATERIDHTVDNPYQLTDADAELIRLARWDIDAIHAHFATQQPQLQLC